MSEHQERICTFLRWFLGAHDYAPSLAEIAGGIGLSKAGTYHHLTVLRAQGRIDWLAAQPRTFHLTESASG